MDIEQLEKENESKVKQLDDFQIEYEKMKENLQFLEAKNTELIINAKKADEPNSLSEELNLLTNTFDCKTCAKVF